MIHALLIAATVATASNPEATKQPTPEKILTAGEATISIPENFFRAFVQPSGKVAFGYAKPSVAEPSQAANLGWWNTVAKLRLLKKEDPDFLAAYHAAETDPDLQATGITFQAWAEGSQEEKAEVRKRLQDQADLVAKKHRLQELLEFLPVSTTRLAELSAELRGAIPKASPLIKYCPGAVQNISVDPQHPDFHRYQRMIEGSETSTEYKSAIAEFEKYLASNPRASIDDRNAELEKLLAPILVKVR